MRTSSHIYLFICLLFINFTKRPESLTKQAPLRGLEKKKKRKLVIQLFMLNMNGNTLETTKKRNGNAKTELGRTSIKNQQHMRSSKLFNGRLVWHLIRTLVSTSLINRLSEIQVVIKMISVPEVGW